MRGDSNLKKTAEAGARGPEDQQDCNSRVGESVIAVAYIGMAYVVMARHGSRAVHGPLWSKGSPGFSQVVLPLRASLVQSWAAESYDALMIGKITGS